MDMDLNTFSSDVVGFDSTWNVKQVLVKDSSTDDSRQESGEKHEHTNTAESSEKEVQTVSVVTSNNSDEGTDKKLAAWLRKILPALEKELEEGLTVSRPQNPPDKNLNIELYQEIDIRGSDSNSNIESSKGSVAWLSVLIQDSAVLAVSCSTRSDNQLKSFVKIYEPRRSKDDAKIYWHELKMFPVEQPIEFLSTNIYNRDMFAGASKTNLYIWSYLNKESLENDRVLELFSKSSDDSIVGLTFLSEYRLLTCLIDGKLILYKIASKQSLKVDKLMKIEPKNLTDPSITSVVALTEDEFILGLMNGTLLHCTTNQIVPQDNIFNPVIREIHSHKFAVSSLKHCIKNGKSYIVSCDVSGEVFFHTIEFETEKQLKFVIKLPLPLKSLITCQNDLEHIICLAKDSIEIFRTSSKAIETTESPAATSGNFIKLSKNEMWLVSGLHKEIFRIYRITNDVFNPNYQ